MTIIEVAGEFGLFLDQSLPERVYRAIQIWCSLGVMVGCVLQLVYDSKLNWPPEPGRISIWASTVGSLLAVRLKLGWPYPGAVNDLTTVRIAIAFLRAGEFGDFLLQILGRVATAGQAGVALGVVCDAIGSKHDPIRPAYALIVLCLFIKQLNVLSKGAPKGKATT